MKNEATLVLTAMAAFIAACSPIPSAPAKAPGPDLSGEWVVTTESPMGSSDADMVVKQTGEALAGTMTSELGAIAFTGAVEGQQVDFGFLVNAQGMDLKIDYSGVIEGDTMRGKAVFGAFGEGAFTAKRKGT